MKRILENPEVLTLRLFNPPELPGVKYADLFYSCYQALDQFKDRCSLTGMQNVNLTLQQIADRIEFHFLCFQLPANQVPKSATVYSRNPTSVTSEICYCADDLATCPDIIESRFAYECTRAIRRVLAIEMNINPLTPRKSPPPGENRYN
jgi:hypothetical protein